ncbi:hypothetical protein SPHINGO8BC_110085 [Sphingobacterium multivorum]|uniref:Uncharacterized protein n=1 Tax=Sphingobacterium multivorum TaxID=28454 RepID=A0A653Y6N7_SPHMU|nr:hypothetical protein SPHINGO8BC_110085 [Sphingobacterium multivorum]
MRTYEAPLVNMDKLRILKFFEMNKYRKVIFVLPYYIGKDN